MTNMSAGFFQLTKFFFRLDRLRIILWLGGITFFTLIVPVSFVELYGSEAERAAMAETMANPAMTAMVGPADLTNYSLGVMTTHQMLLMTAAVSGLMSILLIAGRTRGDEESGRLELIQSLPVGRLAYLNGTILYSIVVSFSLALITGFGLAALNIAGMDLEGSLLYGAALGGSALMFAGVTAVAAQLSESTRGTIGISIAFLLAAYLFRAVTDISNESLSWLSPLGWVTKTEAYSANSWWPVLLMAGFSIMLFAAAGFLNAIRDLESGFLPSRTGRGKAGPFLQNTLGLAWRLQRTAMIAWACGLIIIGSAYGSVLGDMESFFAGNELMEQLIQPDTGLSLTESFLPMLMVVLSLLAAVPPMMAMNKLRGEEKKGRLDHLLGRTVSRHYLLGSFLLLALINGFVMLLLSATGLWAAGNAVMEEGLSFVMIFEAAIIYFPAIFVMVSFTVLLIGWFPKFTPLIWLYLIYSFVVVYMGGLFQLDEVFEQMTPFGHVPQPPVEEITFLPLLLLMAAGGIISAVGFAGFAKRDID